MASIRRFEDIDAWKRAREPRRAVYAVSKNGGFAKDPALRDQVRRAAVSVTSNIAEGFERGGNREFVQFLSHSKGSVAEINDQLYVALDGGYISQREFDELTQTCHEVGRFVAGFMAYLIRADIRGPKFKPASGGTNQKLETRNPKPVPE